MSGRKHDPAWVNQLVLNAARALESNGYTVGDMTPSQIIRTVLDAVADDIATAERERVLAEVEALADEWLSTGSLLATQGSAGLGLRALVASLRGGEGS